MKKEQWFISNPDESQLEVIKTGLSKNLVVVGSAGSGKTNLTLFKAKQADARGDSWGVIVASRAMRRMISYGLDAIGLNGERVTYSWAWTNRGGFDLRGDLYWEEGNPENIFLVNGNEVSRFRRLNQEYSINELVVGEYTIDFPDWVNEKYYKAFGRRTSNYTRINFEQDKFDLNAYTLLNTAVLTRNEDKPIDHIFVDEAQDLKIREYEDQYVPRARENIVFFGDDNQRITSGATMSLIAKCFKADMLHLNYNYRVPKSIARFAQSIMNTDLISSNMKDGGDSDYPKYPKPTLEWYPTLRDILDAIVTQVKLEDLKDVAILIPSGNTGGDKSSCLLLSSWIPVKIDSIDIYRHYRYSDIQCIFAYLNSIGVDVMTFYRTQRPAPYQTIDTLDFTNNDLISLLSIDDAKGSEFSHVFVILPSHAGGEVQNEMSYIACTRATESLHLFYYGDYEPALISKQEGSDYNLLDVRSKRPNDYVKPSMFREDGGILCLDILYSEEHSNLDRENLYLPGDELDVRLLASCLRLLNKRESENKVNNGLLD